MSKNSHREPSRCISWMWLGDGVLVFVTSTMPVFASAFPLANIWSFLLIEHWRICSVILGRIRPTHRKLGEVNGICLPCANSIISHSIFDLWVPKHSYFSCMTWKFVFVYLHAVMGLHTSQDHQKAIIFANLCPYMFTINVQTKLSTLHREERFCLDQLGDVLRMYTLFHCRQIDTCITYLWTVFDWGPLRDHVSEPIFNVL